MSTASVRRVNALLLIPMRIITCNVNGIRSAAKRGFFAWLATQNADVVCIQELRVDLADLISEYQRPSGLYGYFHPAEKKGYSGVAVYTRHEPKRVQFGWGWPEIDQEGRYLRVDFSALTVISVYFPSGSSGETRQAIKYLFMERLLPELCALRASKRDVILCGDWNIAHTEHDLKNWRANQKNSGFLPDERAWLTRVFTEAGLVDVFRLVNQERDQYTWWSNRGQAWAKNVGWRIDYQIATPEVAAQAHSVHIYKAERFSDHAPLIIDYDYKLK